jgi:hypothetical protein
LARPYRQYAKDDFENTCQRSNKILKYHLRRCPANLKQFLSDEIGTNPRSLAMIINEGPNNTEEIEILDYYIWKVAAPLLKHENQKMRAENHEELAIEDEDLDD